MAQNIRTVFDTPNSQGLNVADPAEAERMAKMQMYLQAMRGRGVGGGGGGAMPPVKTAQDHNREFVKGNALSDALAQMNAPQTTFNLGNTRPQDRQTSPQDFQREQAGADRDLQAQGMNLQANMQRLLLEMAQGFQGGQASDQRGFLGEQAGMDRASREKIAGMEVAGKTEAMKQQKVKDQAFVDQSDRDAAMQAIQGVPEIQQSLLSGDSLSPRGPEALRVQLASLSESQRKIALEFLANAGLKVSQRDAAGDTMLQGQGPLIDNVFTRKFLSLGGSLSELLGILQPAPLDTNALAGPPPAAGGQVMTLPNVSQPEEGNVLMDLLRSMSWGNE